MTHEEKRIAIAEACGYKRCFLDASGFPFGCEPDSVYAREIPDYLNSLDAMHAAEESLPDDLKWKFSERLANIVDADYGSFAHIHATAQQRANAFLSVIQNTP